MSENGVHDSQLLKGVLSLALLRLLAERESYGYELVTQLHAMGLTEVQDGKRAQKFVFKGMTTIPSK